jgi:DNA-directed RNA polymerase specialized sigma24 family protein
VSARKVRLSSGAELSDLNDRSAFVGMFDNHAAHLYDYCLSLLGDEAEAASASTVTLVAAYMLGGRMNEPGQLRAWMLALARRECLSDSPTRREPWAKTTRRRPGQSANGGGGSLDDADTGELAKIELEIQPLMTGLTSDAKRTVRLVPRTAPPRVPRPDPYREVLDLVHRHGISPAELPAILDISADEAQDLLAAAPVMTSLATARATARRRDPAAPLASMPGSVWRETASVVFDSEQSAYCQAVAADAGRLWAEGFPLEPSATKPPSQRKMAMTSVGLAAALLAPAALGAALYAVFAASPHSVTRSHDYAIVPPPSIQSSASPGTPAVHSAGPSVQPRVKHKHPITSIFSTNPASAPVVPQPSTKTSHRTTSSPPVINSSPPTITPTSPGSGSSTSSSPSPTALPSGGATSGSPAPSPSGPSPSG